MSSPHSEFAAGLGRPPERQLLAEQELERLLQRSRTSSSLQQSTGGVRHSASLPLTSQTGLESVAEVDARESAIVADESGDVDRSTLQRTASAPVLCPSRPIPAVYRQQSARPGRAGEQKPFGNASVRSASVPLPTHRGQAHVPETDGYHAASTVNEHGSAGYSTPPRSASVPVTPGHEFEALNAQRFDALTQHVSNASAPGSPVQAMHLLDHDASVLNPVRECGQAPRDNLALAQGDDSDVRNESAMPDDENPAIPVAVNFPFAAHICESVPPPSASKPRRIECKPGEEVTVLDCLPSQEFFVHNKSTGHLGVVPVTALEDSRPQFHYHADGNSGFGSNGDNGLTESFAQEGSVEDLASAKETVVHMSHLVHNDTNWNILLQRLRPTNFTQLDSYLKSMARRVRILCPEVGLRAVCEETRLFLEVCSKHIAVVERHATGQDAAGIRAADARLRVLHICACVLLHLPNNGRHYNQLVKSEEFKLLVDACNLCAISAVRVDLAATILAFRNGLIRALVASLPTSRHQQSTTVAGYLAMTCCSSNIFLLQYLLIVQACISANAGNPKATCIPWDKVQLRWCDLHVPAAALIHSVCNEARLGFYDELNPSLPVEGLVKGLLASSLTEWSMLEAAEAVWPLLSCSNLEDENIRRMIKLVATQFSSQSSQATLQSEVHAAHYMPPDQLKYLIEMHDRTVSLAKLHHIFTSVDGSTHERRDSALRTVQQLVFDTFYQSQILSHHDPCAVIEHGLTSDDVEQQWAFSCIALAIVNGQQIDSFYTSWEQAASIFDRLARLGYGSQMEASLEDILISLHTSLGSNPLYTVNAIMKSEFLRQCHKPGANLSGRVISLQATESAAHLILAANNCLMEVQKSIRSSDFSSSLFLSEHCAMRLFWKTYCNSLHGACQSLQAHEVRDLHHDLERQLKEIEQALATSTCTSILAGCLASTMMGILQLSEPEFHQEPSGTLLALLRICSHIQKVLGAEQFQPYHAQAGTMAMFVNYTDTLRRIVICVESCQYTRKEFDDYYAHHGNMRALYAAANISIVHTIENFDDVDMSCQRKLVLLRWLALRRVPNARRRHDELLSAFAEQGSHLCEVKALLEQVDSEYTRHLSYPIGPGQHHCPAHEYIVCTVANSNLCSALSPDVGYVLTDYEWIKNVRDCLVHVYHSVEHLLSPNTEYIHLSNLAGSIARNEATHGGDGMALFTLSKDTKTVLANSVPHQTKQEDIKRLQRLLHCIAWARLGIDGVLTALELSPLADSYVKHPWKKFKQMKPRLDAPLSSVDANFIGIYELTSGFEEHHYKFFNLVRRGICNGMFAFFRDELCKTDQTSSVRTRLQLVNSRLEGDTHRTALMSSLLDVEDAIKPFFTGEASQILQLFQTKVFDCGMVLDTAQNMGTIQRLLDTLAGNAFDTAKEILTCLRDNAQAIVEIFHEPGQPYRYRCLLEVDSSDKDPKWQSMSEMRQFHVCLPYLYHIEQWENLAHGMSESIAILEKLLGKVQELEACGCFNYLRQMQCIQLPLRKDNLSTRLAEVCEKLCVWYELLADAKLKCPALRLFSDYDIGSMSEHVQMLTTDGRSDHRQHASLLLWILLSASHLISSKPEQLTQPGLLSALEQVGSKEDDNVLDQLVRLLQLVTNRHFVRPTRDGIHALAPVVQQYLCTVEGCHSFDDRSDALVSLFCQSFRDHLPCRAQFLFCSPHTTEAELRSFSNAVGNSSGTFAVVGIDLLTADCLSALLELQQFLAQPRQQQEHACTSSKVFYLAYNSAFHSCWPKLIELEQAVIPRGSVDNLRTCYNALDKAGKFSLGLELIVVGGPAGVGKTTWINEMCRREDGALPVVIDLIQVDRTADICQVLMVAVQGNERLQQRTGSIHFRLPSNANLADVDRVFFELVWCGAMRSTDTRHVVAIEPNSGRKFKWFIEMCEDGFSDCDTDNSVYCKLPFLMTSLVCKPLQRTDSKKMILSTEHEKLARLLDLFFGHKLGTDVIDGNISVLCSDWVIEKQSLYMFDRLFQTYGLPRDNRVQEVFCLKYIAAKWKTMLETTKLLKDGVSYKDLAWEVMHQIILEAKYLATPNLRCVFRGCSQAFLACDAFSLMATDITQQNVPNLLVLRNRNDRTRSRSWTYIPVSREKQIGLLSWAFQIEKRDVERLVSDSKFVLTADFTFKLILIKQRQQLGLSLILESETGAGKTYLLKFYTMLSAFATANSSRMEAAHRAEPRLLNLLKQIIFGPLWTELSMLNRIQYPRCGSAWQPLPDRLKGHLGFSEGCDWHDFGTEHLFESWLHFLSLLRREPASNAKRLLQEGIRSWCNKLTILEPLSIEFSELLADPNLTDAHSKRLLEGWLETKTKDLFRKMLVHPGLVKEDIRRFLLDDVVILAENTHGHSVVVFFDEFNTSRYMHLFKEIMLDGTFDGQAIPHHDQLFFVAALNPCNKEDQVHINGPWSTNYFAFEPNATEDDEILKRCDRELGQVYNISVKLPTVMKYHRWIYQSLTGPDELFEYTEGKIDFLKTDPRLDAINAGAQFSDRMLGVLKEFLFHSYCFCRDNVTRSFVSQRDVQRVFKLIPHFWSIETNLLEPDDISDANQVLQKCILLSISLVFLVRLPLEPTRKYRRASRAKFDVYVSNHVQRKFKAIKLSLQAMLEDEINRVVTKENFLIPYGVALTPALKENIFCMIACIQEKIPMGIIGEPGSSKTLSYQIVRQNLSGEHGSVTKFCQQFGAIDPFFYQCSPESSTDQIQKLFNSAIDRKDYYRKHRPTPVSSALKGRGTRVTVFIDEAGLLSVKRNRMVMKVLHPYLDEPEVSFVTMSNHWFDAANTNRMLTVFRSRAAGQGRSRQEETGQVESRQGESGQEDCGKSQSGHDLISLAYGCLCLQPELCPPSLEQFLHGICNGYRRVCQMIPDWFHQRDLIALFRFFLRSKLVTGSEEINMTADSLLRALEESFGGRHPEEFKAIANAFFEEVHSRLASFPQEIDVASLRTPIDIALQLRKKLHPENASEHFTNLSAVAPRYLLFIDDYGCDYNTVDMLYQLGVLSRNPGQTLVFQQDDGMKQGNDVQCASILAQLRQFLNQPCTVVIVNSPRLHGYLYELFNKNYLMLQEKGKCCAFSNIAMGDGTFPCQIHPNFQCIIILSREIATRERTPFLSRFSKHTLHPCQGWEYVLRNTDADRLLRSVQKQCELFTTQMNAHYFFGAGSDSTAAPGKVVIEEGTPRMSSSAAADQLQWSSMFSGTLFLQFLNLLKSSGNGRFSVHDRGQTPAGDFVRLATRRIVASYFQLMPLESYISSCQLLTPPSAYHKFFVESRQNSFTLRAILENTLRTTEHSRDKTAKLMLLTKSTSSDVQRLTRSSDLRERCLGRTLSEMTEIHILSKFQHFSELRQAMEEFSRGPMACTVFSVDVSQPSQKSAIGPLKRLIDDHCTQLRRNGIKQTKLFVILLDVLLKNPLHKDACGAMLNGWKSNFVSVDSLSSCCPISIPEFLSFTKWSGSWEPPGRQNHVSRLKPLLEKHVDLFCDHFCRSLHDVRMSNAHLEMLPASVRPLFAPISASSPSHSEVRLKALKWVIETVPGIFAWLANALISWLIEEGSEWAEKFSKQIIKQDIYVSLEDLIFVETDAALKDLMQTLLLALLSDYNLHNVLQLVEQKCLVEKLLMLVPARRVDLATDGRLFHGNRHLYTTPFFQEFITHVNAAVSTERETLGAVHEGMMKSVVVRPLLDMRAFLELCVVDSLVYKFDWKKPRLTLEVAARFVQLNYTEQMAFGVEGPPDLFSFTHVHIRKNRQLLLSALHGSNALLKLIGREACAEEVHQLVGDTNPALQARDLLHRLGCVLVEKLWSELNKILCSGSYEPDKLLPQLLRWKKTVDYAFQYWPFHYLQSSQGQGAKQPVDAVPESSAGQVKLVVAANLVLSSLTSTNPHPLLKVLRTLIPDDSARDVSLDKILDRLLSQHEEIHLPSEIVQLKYGCGEWFVQRLMLQTFSTVGECVNDHDFELLLTCIHGSYSILRFDHCYMPAKSGAALLAKIEDKLVKDLNCPRSRVQHGIEQAISKWIGVQKGEITLTFTPGHLPSGTSSRAKRKEPVMPLEQAFYELAYTWRRQIRLPNLDAFEYHVNAACDDGMIVRRDFRREMQDRTPLSTLSIQEMAKKCIATEEAAAGIQEYAQQTHRQGSIAGQQGFPDAQPMAKLFAAIEEESAFLDLFTWKIVTTINCPMVQDAISGIGDKWAVTLSERCRPLVLLQYSNSLLSNSINTAECEILPCLVQRKNFAGPRQDLNSSLKISGLPKTLHLLAQQDGSSSYFRRMEACLVWKAFNEDFKFNRIGIQTMYSKLAPGGNLEGVYRLLFSNSGPICEEFWDMIGGNGSAAEYHMLEEMYVSTLVAIISMGPNCHLHTCVYCPDILRGSYIFGSLSSHGKQLGQAEAQSSIIDGFLRTCVPDDAHGLAWPVMAFEARKRPSRLSVLGAMLSSLLTCIALCWHTVLFPTATDNVIADQDHDQGLSPPDARSLLTKRCLAAARSLFNEMSRAELSMSPLSMKSYMLTALQCMVEHANNPTGPTFRASYINLPQLEEMEAAFQRDVVETALETHCATLNRYLTRSLGESFAALHWAQLRSQYNCQRDVWYAAHADNPILAYVMAYHPRLQLVRRLLSIMKFFVDIHAFGSRQFYLADVITNTLAVKDGIDLIGGQAGRLLQETFEQAKVDYNIISKAISRMPMEVVGPWQHSPIIDTTPLKDLVNIHSPQTQGSRLNHLITLVLSWQTALYTLCSRHSKVARSPLDMYLAQNLHAEAVMPADVIAHNGAELLEMSSDDLEQLLRVHCQHDRKSRRLVMNIDADTMEVQVVTRHISKMRRISWDSYSSATHFFFQDEDGLVFSVTPSSPTKKTDLRQDIELEHVLFNISNAQLTDTLLDLRQLMRDIKQQNWPDDGQRHKQSLDQYMEHARQSHSVEYPNLQAFGRFIRLENLGALQLALERRQHRSEFTQIPRSLAHAMRGEDQKTILEQLEELVHASGDLARSVEFLKRFRDALLTVQRQVEKQPSLSLLTLLTQDVGTESTENSLDESVLHSILPVGVLGLHLKQLVIMVSSFLKEVTAKQLEQEILSKTPRDPCCLEVVRRPSAADELATSLVVEVVDLNDTTRPVKRVVTAQRSDSVLHVINQVLQRLNCTQTFALYGMGGKLFQHSKDQKVDVLARRHAQTNSNGEPTVTVYLQEKEEEDEYLAEDRRESRLASNTIQPPKPVSRDFRCRCGREFRRRQELTRHSKFCSRG
ncbi:uncharacterized protein LOC135823905 [Sycon ciliatum]|uniref:uncharacterized protein LOC135823905 n=1 Tax=Sycon ciliatum TaxID=27933 RepID=UPI0031F5F387